MFNLNKEWFEKRFNACSSAVNSRSPKEVLTNVYLSRRDDQITMIGTDTETSIVITSGGGEITCDCRVLLPKDRMSRILKETDSEQIIIDPDGSSIEVECNGAKFSLPTSDPNEFPLPNKLSTVAHPIDFSVLKKAINRTVFATDSDSARYALNAIRIESANEGIVVVGTDGRRLAKVNVGQGNVDGSLIPATAAKLIAGLDIEGNVAISSDTNFFMLESPSYTLITRQIEGRFPNWKQVIPNLEGYARATTTARNLIQAIAQAAIVVDNETRGVDFTFTSGNLALKSKAASKGSAAIRLPLEYSGDELTMRLDHKYASEYLRTFDPDELACIYVKDEKLPVVISDDASSLYVLMPMALT